MKQPKQIYSKTTDIVLKTHQNQNNKNQKRVSTRRKVNKFLGVEIDKNLYWNLHMQKLCKKLEPMLGMLF